MPVTKILAGLEANNLDLGVLCPPKRLPDSLRVTHRFSDGFTLIAPRNPAAVFQSLPQSGQSRIDWLTLQRLPMDARFVRELVVVVRRHGKTPEHLTRFVDNVLF